MFLKPSPGILLASITLKKKRERERVGGEKLSRLLFTDNNLITFFFSLTHWPELKKKVVRGGGEKLSRLLFTGNNLITFFFSLAHWPEFCHMATPDEARKQRYYFSNRWLGHLNKFEIVKRK